MLKPITSEKAVKLIELNNTIIFEADIRKTKTQIKKEIENIFKIKIEKINVLIKANKKYVYAKLNKKDKAIDVATKLGMI